MHKLEVKNGKVYLDDKEVEAVTDFEIKSSAKKNHAELSLNLLVNLSNLSIVDS